MSEARTHNYFSSIKEFTFLDDSSVGRGSFGVVKLAFHLRTNRIYAIKIVNLNTITTDVGIRALEMEIEIHLSVDHPHIIKLWEVIEDGPIIYMIMEYAENGNLFSFQNIKQIFSQSEAYVFFSQAVSAIKYLHLINIMHRDLKPENFLLDKQYNLKVCDFGWATEGIMEKKRTFCGTYEYMAPQMIQGKDYDYRIDVWALGILLYELLHGYAPFEGDNTKQVKNSMEAGEVELNPNLSIEVSDLIEKILRVNPKNRLSLNQIQSHPWINKQLARNSLKMFKSMDSVKIKQKEREGSGGRELYNQLNQKQPEVSQKDKSSTLKKKSPSSNILNGINCEKSMRIKAKIQNPFERYKLTKKMIKVNGEKIKQKQITHIYYKEKHNKQNHKHKLVKGHRLQKSQLTEFKNSTRIVTDGNESKKMTVKKKQSPIRYNTEMNEINDHFFEIKTAQKKKKITRKKIDQFDSSMNNKNHIKFKRKTLQFC